MPDEAFLILSNKIRTYKLYLYRLEAVNLVCFKQIKIV